MTTSYVVIPLRKQHCQISVLNRDEGEGNVGSGDVIYLALREYCS